MTWRLVEWSLVMGALCWLFVYAWTAMRLGDRKSARR
jgi:hypothetical protein